MTDHHEILPQDLAPLVHAKLIPCQGYALAQKQSLGLAPGRHSTAAVKTPVTES